MRSPEPAALLLDEPFSNLDTALRARVRTEVHELLHRVGITTVFVTHDQDEAFVLGDQVAVMSDGVIVQQAPPHRIYADPASAWIARFVGDANLVPGTAVDGHTQTPVGRLAIRSQVDGKVDVLLRPEDFVLAGQRADGEQPPVVGIPVDVELVEYYGHDTVYVVTLEDGTRVKVREVAVPRFDRGDRTTLVVEDRPHVAFAAG